MAERLTSRYIYVYKNKFRGTVWGIADMRILERKSGIPYHWLRWWFGHQKKISVEFDGYRIDRLLTSMIFNKMSK